MSMTNHEIVVRYPWLLRAMMFVACLSAGEAIACIRDYKEGRNSSSEAVDHYGGCRAVLERASSARCREITRLIEHELRAESRTFGG